LGPKFENNDYTGLEIQPSGRLLWTPHERHSVWAAVSRAVRTPSRAEVESRIVNSILRPGAPPGFLPFPAVVTVVGNQDFQSEVLMAYELGYRVQAHERLSLDLAAFYNDYDRLRSTEPAAPDTSNLPAYLQLPYVFSNQLKGQTYGAELAANFSGRRMVAACAAPTLTCKCNYSGSREVWTCSPRPPKETAITRSRCAR